MRVLAYLLLLVVLILAPFVTQESQAEEERIPSVDIRLTPEPTGRALGTKEPIGTAVVHVEVFCRLPTALVPGWRIHHEVQVDPPAARATVSENSWDQALDATGCADGTPTTYEVSVDIAFDDTTYEGGAVRFTFYANATLPGGANASTGWDEIVGIRGGVDIVAKTKHQAFVGEPLSIRIAVVSRTDVPLTFTGRSLTEPTLGTATGGGTGFLQPGEGKGIDVTYTPQTEGTDRFDWVVSANAEGARLAERTFPFEVEVLPARGATAEEALLPAPSIPLVLGLLFAAVYAARRRAP